MHLNQTHNFTDIVCLFLVHFFPLGWRLSTSSAEELQVMAHCTLITSKFCESLQAYFTRVLCCFYHYNEAISVVHMNNHYMPLWCVFISSSNVEQWAASAWSSTSSSLTLSPRSGLASYSCTSSNCSVTGTFTDRSSVCSFCEDVS